MRAASLVCLLAFIGLSFAVRSHWIQLQRADANKHVTVHVALTQFNLDILESTLLDISDTKSANYGKWLTSKAVTELVAPPRAVSMKVAAFIKQAGAIKVEDRRDSIKVTGTVAFIEKFFQTTLYNFIHKNKAVLKIRAVGPYTIPHQIADHVDFVAGLYEFPTLKNTRKAPAGSFDGVVIPQTLFNLYGIPTNVSINPKSSVCVVEFQDATAFTKEDMLVFTKAVGIHPIVISHTVGPFQQQPFPESELDAQYAGAIGQNTSLWYWTDSDWMYDFAADFLASKEFPLVVSMSYGWPDPDQCQVGNCTGDETSLQYFDRTNVEFQKIGAIGVSLFASSGDQGAPGDDNPNCASHGRKVLSSLFPASSPWVTAVGATMLTPSTHAPPGPLPPACTQFQCASSTTELVCTWPTALITTGGGFSNYAPMPSFQSDVVNAYLKSGVHLPSSKYFNSSNRAFPDVSALGHNYLIADANALGQVDGTSCSSPVFAAIVSLLNSYRLNAGKSSLGFITPLLYQAAASDPTIFNDITTGDNDCTEQCCGNVGYQATTGWDPVTGLGTPKFAKLLAYINTLP